jgi:hypothetical protein
MLMRKASANSKREDLMRLFSILRPARYPMWSRNGHELFFETLDNHIMVAAYTVKGDSLRDRQAAGVFRKNIGGVGGDLVKNIDLASDGKRIVALIPVETAEAQKSQNQVTFLMNFSDELRSKVPVGK